MIWQSCSWVGGGVSFGFSNLKEVQAMYIHICGSINHNIQKVEATQVSIDRWMDPQGVFCNIQLNTIQLKKEGKFDTAYIMNEPWGYYAEWNQPVTKGTNTLWFYFYEVPRRVTLGGCQGPQPLEGDRQVVVSWGQSFSLRLWKGV